MMGRCFVLAVCALLLAGANCTPPPVEVHSHTTLAGHGAPRKLAVAPFVLAPSLAAAKPGAGTTPEVAAQLVAHQLAEALVARGFEVVAPSDVERALQHMDEALSETAEHSKPSLIARLVAQEFGADALLLGTLTRWVPREGGEYGAAKPAAVGFDVTLRRAPDARRLWSGAFDERQKPAGENVFVTRQYPGGGLRWLSAEELARWGVGRLVRAMPQP